MKISIKPIQIIKSAKSFFRFLWESKPLHAWIQTIIIVATLLITLQQTRNSNKSLQNEISDIKNQNTTFWYVKIQKPDSGISNENQSLHFFPTNDNCIIDEIRLSFLSNYRLYSKLYFGDLIPIKYLIKRVLNSDNNTCLTFSANKYIQQYGAYYCPIIASIKYNLSDKVKVSNCLCHLLFDEKTYLHTGVIKINKVRFVKKIRGDENFAALLLNEYFHGTSYKTRSCITEEATDYFIRCDSSLHKVNRFCHGMRQTAEIHGRKERIKVPLVVISYKLQKELYYLIDGTSHLPHKVISGVLFIDDFLHKYIVFFHKNYGQPKGSDKFDKNKFDEYYAKWIQVIDVVQNYVKEYAFKKFIVDEYVYK